jgi:hypothetical protein
MPKKTAVPNACRISAPGPVEIIGGCTPMMEAKVVTRIGLESTEHRQRHDQDDGAWWRPALKERSEKLEGDE